MSWVVYALGSAIFAALTSILAKVGIKGVDSNLATAIRTLVIIIFAWGIVFAQKSQTQIHTLSKTTLLFLVLSGLATGISWLFYFKALQLGEASKVAPIDKLSLVFTVILATLFLREKLSVGVVLGTSLMTLGGLVIILVK
jgi:bacterial/archaeal transporter family protein